MFEATKKGEPHLHLLLRAPFIPQKWLSEQMNELIEAPIVDIRKVGHARNAGRYVAKYVGKGPKPFAALKRYWTSQGYNLEEKRKRRSPEDGGDHWWIEREPLWLLFEKWHTRGEDCHWVSTSEFWSLPRLGPPKRVIMW